LVARRPAGRERYQLGAGALGLGLADRSRRPPRQLRENAMQLLGFAVGSRVRLSKVARTIADLLGQDDLDAGCLLEAAAYRDADPTADLVSRVA
jgi:hypothetical protein